MSEFHYYVPTSDDHVSLWFYVRRFADGATEVETVVENGWLFAPGPGRKDYAVDLVISGRTRFSGSSESLAPYALEPRRLGRCRSADRSEA
jgi:hypothetical protein